MNSYRANNGSQLGGLPSDRFYASSPLAWIDKGRRLVAIVGLTAAVALVLAIGVGIVPMFFGFRTFVVVSGSMEPTIATGSIAIAMPVASADLQVGDVIAFSPSSEAALPIVHRIVKIEERAGVRYFTTRGDANAASDAELALPPKSLRVVAALPMAGYAVYFAAQPMGTLLLVWVPILLLAGLFVKDRIAKWRQTR